MPNKYPLKRLGLRSSEIPGVFPSLLEVFTGHRPRRPLLSALPVTRYKTEKTEDEVRARQLIHAERTRVALSDMHLEVKTPADASHKHQVQANS